MNLKLSASALFITATMLATTSAQASPQTTFSQLSASAIDKLRTAHIDVGAMLNNSSNDFIVQFDEQAFAKSTESQQGKATRVYKEVKDSVFSELSDIVVLRDYYGSPTSFVRVKNDADLVKLLNNPYVTSVSPNRVVTLNLKESLDFIRQPEAAKRAFKPANSYSSSKFNGEGSVIAILDTGLDPYHKDFGNCWGGLNSSGCKVADVIEIANDTSTGRPDGEYDSGSYHGSNVSAIAGGVAPKAKLIGLDVFRWSTNWYGQKSQSAPTSDIQAGLNWIKNNHIDNNPNGYNFVSANMSLGGGSELNYQTRDLPILGQLKKLGVATVAAAGNEEHTRGISWPASEVDAISVGAVFDTDEPRKRMSCNKWSQDGVWADQVTCFSNSGDYLDLLAPGAYVSAGGETMSGTSQASPHVAGALAVLRAPEVLKATKTRWSNESVDDSVNRLKDTGVKVVDYRNGLERPRIDLYAAIDVIARSNPANADPVKPVDPIKPVEPVEPVKPIRQPTGWKWYDCYFLNYCV